MRCCSAGSEVWKFQLRNDTLIVWDKRGRAVASQEINSLNLDHLNQVFELDQL